MNRYKVAYANINPEVYDSKDKETIAIFYGPKAAEDAKCYAEFRNFAYTSVLMDLRRIGKQLAEEQK